jgi:hypothetical protein
MHHGTLRCELFDGVSKVFASCASLLLGRPTKTKKLFLCVSSDFLGIWQFFSDRSGSWLCVPLSHVPSLSLSLLCVSSAVRVPSPVLFRFVPCASQSLSPMPHWDTAAQGRRRGEERRREERRKGGATSCGQRADRNASILPLPSNLSVPCRDTSHWPDDGTPRQTDGQRTDGRIKNGIHVRTQRRRVPELCALCLCGAAVFSTEGRQKERQTERD